MNNLNTFLKNTGIKLSPKELEDFSQDLPVDVDGKVDLENVTLKMKDFTGEKIDASDLQNILGDMRIEVNDKECLKLQKLLPVDDNKKVFQNRLLSALKSFKGGKINVNNLNTLLGNMGIKLKNKEFKSVVQNQPMDGGKVDVSNLEDALENMKIKFPDKKLKDLSQNLPTDASGMVDLHKLLKERNLKKKERKKFTGGKVEAKDIHKALGNMGIELTDRELWRLLKMLPMTTDGMVKKNTLLDYIKAFPGGKCRTSKIASWKTWVMSWRVRKLRTCRTNCRLMVKRLN
ncbi:uncharacterized protein AAEQ78_013120 isoform 5-T5 [Lycaon pictus]